MYSGKHIFITGGAGFIGSHLSERLLKTGAHITCLDNFDSFYPRALKERNLRQCYASKEFTLHEIDIREKELLRKVIVQSKPELIIHIAAKAGIQDSMLNPLEYFSTNVLGTLNTLELMREYEIPKMIFTSSSSVYGKQESLPFKEDQACGESFSPYALSKHAAENLCQLYSKLHNLSIITLRPFSVYGPRLRPDLAISTFMRLLHNDKPINIHGDGSFSRDYTYISDIIDGIMLATKRLLNESTKYELYNLGNSTPITINDLISTIQQLTGKKFIINYQDAPTGIMSHTWASLDKSSTDLDYSPKVSLEEGISRYLSWYKSNK